MSIYPRERISEALRDSANRGIVMVVAPAGFGKTEAVGDAFGKAAHWVTLSENGTSVEWLARLIIEAAVPDYTRALGPLLARAVDAENRAHLTRWVAAHLRSVEQPIVLEDFQHVCSDTDGLTFVRDIVEATTPAVRWVFVTREVPELPIGSWLAHDYMTLPITTEDLTFDVGEAEGVAAAMGVEIATDALDELVRDVSGWPLAVRLSLGSWGRTRSLPPLRIRTRAVLFDFIESEVWNGLAETERNLLTAAAHISDLQPRILGAAGFSDTRLTLERLHRRLPLLSRLGNGTYRLHELFREFILERATSDSASHNALIKRLARAIERFGTFDEALAMLMRAQEWTAALSLLARRGIHRLESGHRAEVSAALTRFPRRFSDHAVVAGLRGYAFAIDGAYELAKSEIESALAGDLEPHMRGDLMLQCGALALNVRDYTAGISYLRAVMSDERFDEGTRIKAAAALAYGYAIVGDANAAREAIAFCLPGLDSGSLEMRALVRHRLASTYFFLGEYAVAEHYASESALLAESGGLDSTASRAYIVLMNIAESTYADTVLMRRYAEACLRLAEASGDRAMQIYALEFLVITSCKQGDDDLFELSSAQLKLAQGNTPSQNIVSIRFSYSMREAGLGRIDRAIGELQRLSRTQLTTPLALFVEATLAVYYAAHDPKAAAALLDKPMLAVADRAVHAVRYMAYAQAFHALAHWISGRGRAARRAPSPNTSDLTPLDAAIINVIATICSTSRQTITARQLDQLTEPLIALSLGGYARLLRTLLAPASIHELTRTEIDVLRALRGGGTTSEVAERLGKSSHTVLSHIKSACSKLGCSGRAAAIAYAVNQGWID